MTSFQWLYVKLFLFLLLTYLSQIHYLKIMLFALGQLRTFTDMVIQHVVYSLINIFTKTLDSSSLHLVIINILPGSRTVGALEELEVTYIDPECFPECFVDHGKFG